MAVELDFRQVSMEHPDAAGMVAAMVAEIDELYADIGMDMNGPNMPKAGVAEFSPPGGTFVVGYRDGVAVCGGGVKRLPDGACEIKRMYVAPAARRQGLARALLSALEDAARALGYSVVRLDSGPRQGHAVDLYTSEGYVPIGNFNDNPVATYFGEKTL